VFFLPNHVPSILEFPLNRHGGWHWSSPPPSPLAPCVLAVPFQHRLKFTGSDSSSPLRCAVCCHLHPWANSFLSPEINRGHLSGPPPPFVLSPANCFFLGRAPRVFFHFRFRTWLRDHLRGFSFSYRLFFSSPPSRPTTAFPKTFRELSLQRMVFGTTRAIFFEGHDRGMGIWEGNSFFALDLFCRSPLALGYLTLPLLDRLGPFRR